MSLVRIYKQNVRLVKKFVGFQIPYKMNSIFMKFCLCYVPLHCGSYTDTNWCFTCPILLYVLTTCWITIGGHTKTNSIDKCENGRCLTLFTTDYGLQLACAFFNNYHLPLWYILYPHLISRPYLIGRSYTQVFKHFPVLFKPFFDIRLIGSVCSCSGQIAWFAHFDILNGAEENTWPICNQLFSCWCWTLLFYLCLHIARPMFWL